MKRLAGLFLGLILISNFLFYENEIIEASVYQSSSKFQKTYLLAAPNAFFSYGYGTPIRGIPNEQLHITIFGQGKVWLNLYSFIYEPQQEITIIGRNEESTFVLAVVSGSGQIVWFPVFEIDMRFVDLESLSIFFMNNEPNYDGKTALP